MRRSIIPNICQLYDVGPDYLVMELLEGGPLTPVEGTRKLLDVAVQIADGMAAAHAAGIVHRDLKPDNIFVTPDGRVKILDFGIAKAIAGEAADQHTRVSLTGTGTAVGTVHYMSPEQARGLATIGPQSDQFSFGLILYELVTGQKAFARESNAETLTAIIREDAAPLPSSVPAPLRWIIERLLAKDPAERYDSSRDLYRELKQLRNRLSDATGPTSGTTAAAGVAPASKSRTRPRLLLVAAIAVAASLAWILAPREGGELDLTGYRFTPISLEAATERAPVWSPDGRSIAYLASVDGILQVMVREIGARNAVQLTRGASGAQSPFWGPDGSRVYFVSSPSVALWSVSAVGGEPELVIEGATSAAIHPRDGRIVFARGGRLWVLDRSSTGAAKDPQPFGQPPFEGTGTVRAFSPDGAKLAVQKSGALWLLSYPAGAARQLPIAEHLFAGGSISWMPDSRHMVTELPHASAAGVVMVDTDGPTARTILSTPMPVLNPTVSPDGTRLAFVIGQTRWHLAEVTLEDGRMRQLATGSRTSWFPSLAPDGGRLAYADNRGAEHDIREMTLAPSGEVVSRTIATAEGGTGLAFVRWSPDGARVLFAALVPSGFRLMIAPAAGGRSLPLDAGADDTRDGVWSPDGTRIVYARRVGDEQQIVAVRVGTLAAPVVLKRWSVQDAADRARAPIDWSPDGRWILTRQGLNLFLMSADGSNERRLLSDAAASNFSQPIFSRDGRQVLILRRDLSAPGGLWKLFAVDVESGAERVVTSVDLPKTAGEVAGLSLSPDGTRLYTSFADWPFDIWMLEGFR